MDKITRFIVQDRMSDENIDILHRKLFDVNMRLYGINPEYKRLITDIVKYMGGVLNAEYVDYGTPKGISGANVGIPFNIIGVDGAVKGDKDVPIFFLNPKIVNKSDKMVKVKSNCGSIRLAEKIEVERHEWIVLESYDLSGRKSDKTYKGTLGYTIQHEVDHNLGILITDKVSKKEDKR